MATSIMTMGYTPIILTLICLALVPAIALLRQRNSKPNSTFPLMKLPAEVRLLIFERLLENEDRAFESLPPSPKPKPITRLRALKKLLTPKGPPLSYTSLNAVSRQIREEFLHVYWQHGTLTFKLDASTFSTTPFLPLAPTVSRAIKSVHLRIFATPSLVGAEGSFDPRNVSGDWALRDRVVAQLSGMRRLSDVSLTIRASGNQLWNPLWLWYHTSQRFKDSGLRTLGHMSFEMEDFTIREPNHMAREKGGRWEWRCREGHVVGDAEVEQGIKPFCFSLYEDCMVCGRADGMGDI
ncbi:hypothetical protein BT63DRAFT_421304 [Microthyrium microscopicum]|uniref:F-box domain-containing protein n=1 Tax=Microthyrium microscopicum TaxID=703497 RepID=A0A6A6ULG0_9PEZI|nr:hypothetical protein BT63DRAFT_421304 [Microthyrium microscopicum]